MSLSLTAIDTTLEQLAEQRQELMQERETLRRIDSMDRADIEYIDAALEQVDLAIRQYSEELLPAKVDSYWFLLKKIGKKDAPEGLIADAKREIKRLEALIDSYDELQTRLRQNVMAVMGERKVLEGSNGRKLRRQSNGGVQPVEVVQPDLVPEGLKQYAVVMMGDALAWLIALLREREAALIPNHPCILRALYEADGEPYPVSIRAVLERGEGVPGCRIADRGEHLRTA